MRDYEEKSYYEIQLDNKQLILVFLAGVTVCVLIFVLGVMVGKGKKEAEMAAMSKTEAPAVQKPREDTQPPSEAKPIVENKTEPTKNTGKDAKSKQGEDYSFYDLDKAGSEAKLEKKAETPAKTEDKTPPKEKPKPEEQPKPATTAPVEASVPSTTPPATSIPDTEETTVPAGAQRYTVQVMATASKSKAEQQLDLLKSKGYTAYMDEEKGSGTSVYKVRVGKFADSDSAKKVATKLKQELNLETWVAVLD